MFSFHDNHSFHDALLCALADLPVLRRLLFEAGYCELKEGTESRFHDYRHARCTGELSSGGLKVSPGGAACCACKR